LPESVQVRLQRSGELEVPDWTLMAPAGQAAAVGEALRATAPELDAATYDAIRIERGVPAWGRELSDQVTPLESGLQNAISYSKGCYTGQEVIARQTNYDKISRRLAGLRLGAGEWEQLRGAKVGSASGRPGFVSSVAWSTGLGGPIALAIVPRDLADPGADVTITHETGQLRAVVVGLPFVRPPR
jgi:folate-binding protein YgfZ